MQITKLMVRQRTITAVDKMERECIGNQLRMLSRVVTGVYENELRPLRIKPGQMVILAFAARRGQIRAAELSRALQMDASTLSRNLDRMRSKGWLELAPGEDERSRPLRLTREGEKMLDNAIVSWKRAQAKAQKLVGSKGAAFLRRLARTVRDGLAAG